MQHFTFVKNLGKGTFPGLEKFYEYQEVYCLPSKLWLGQLVTEVLCVFISQQPSNYSSHNYYFLITLYSSVLIQTHFMIHWKVRTSCNYSFFTRTLPHPLNIFQHFRYGYFSTLHLQLHLSAHLYTLTHMWLLLARMRLQLGGSALCLCVWSFAVIGIWRISLTDPQPCSCLDKYCLKG